MSLEKLKIRTRSINEEDFGFIFNSWLKCYRASPAVKHVQNTIYYENHHKLIQHLLSNCTVIVACDHDDLSQIFGYLVCERIDGILVVHFMYVKQSFRNLGIATALLEQVGFDRTVASIYTHATDQTVKSAKSYNFVYHPYIAYEAYKKIGVKEYLKKQEAREQVLDEQKEVLKKLED